MYTFKHNQKTIFQCGLTLAFLLSSSPLYPVVILVHGSFGASQEWWRPDGDFFTILQTQAKILGHVVVPFCWSGKPTDQEMFQAAQVLAKLIESYQALDNIILIGHSNGGNVINKATQLLYDPLPDILAQASSRPLQDTLAQVLGQLVQNPPVAQSQPSCSIPISNQHFYTLDLSPMLRENSNYLIEKIYLLGTPVCVEKYHPEMKVVGSVINLFSEGDFIQPVLGMYQRKYPPHERIANVELRFMPEGQSQFIKPGHSQLHDCLVGRWLLNIPDLLQKEGVGNILYLPLS